MNYQDIANLAQTDECKAREELLKKAIFQHGGWFLSVGNKWRLVKPLISKTQQNPSQQPIDVQISVPNLQGMKIIHGWI